MLAPNGLIEVCRHNKNDSALMSMREYRYDLQNMFFQKMRHDFTDTWYTYAYCADSYTTLPDLKNGFPDPT